jgi:serine/threonine protein kinase
MEHAPRKRGFPTDPKEYKLYEEVGEGVSATVYRALCVPLNTFVAIKVLDLEKCSSDLVSTLQFIVIHKTFNSISFMTYPCAPVIS